AKAWRRKSQATGLRRRGNKNILARRRVAAGVEASRTRIKACVGHCSASKRNCWHAQGGISGSRQPRACCLADPGCASKKQARSFDSAGPSRARNGQERNRDERRQRLPVSYSSRSWRANRQAHINGRDGSLCLELERTDNKTLAAKIPHAV